MMTFVAIRFWSSLVRLRSSLAGRNPEEEEELRKPRFYHCAFDSSSRFDYIFRIEALVHSSGLGFLELGH
ncbi:hypothetical protein U1Q18_011626 [Sarracenia purpurea var. burkii]